MSNGLLVHQLSIDEMCIDLKGKYDYYVGLLTMEEEDIKETIQKKGIKELMNTEINVLEYLLMSAGYDDKFFLDLKNAFSTFLKKEILISLKNKMIIVGNPQDQTVINTDNFAEFQLGVRATCHLRIKEPPPEDETPMQRKFRLKREQRDRVKEKQAQKNDDGTGAEFADILSSLCLMESGVSPFNVGKLTIYQVKELLERAQAKEGYHTELDILMAGGDPKKIKPKYWIRNLTKEVN